MKRADREEGAVGFHLFQLGLIRVLWSTRNRPAWLQWTPSFKNQLPWASWCDFWEGFPPQQTPLAAHSPPAVHPLQRASHHATKSALIPEQELGIKFGQNISKHRHVLSVTCFLLRHSSAEAARGAGSTALISCGFGVFGAPECCSFCKTQPKVQGHFLNHFIPSWVRYLLLILHPVCASLHSDQLLGRALRNHQ